MHRCLQVPEIVSLICEQLELKQLLTLVLTSRRLSQPAVDRIWFEVEDFGVLFGAMEDLYELKDFEHDEIKNRSLKCLRRSVHEKDLQLFKKLASRVRKLSVKISPFYIGSISMEMFKAFRRGISPETEVRPLLPKLQTLVMDVEWPLSVDDITLISGLLAPRLHDFTFLHKYPHPEGEVSILKYLRGSQITQLVVDASNPEQHCPIPLDVLRLFTNLEILQTTGFTDDALEVVSTFPKLRSLVLEHPWRSADLGIERKLVSGGFPSLNLLKICCYTTLEATLLALEMLDSSPVEQIIIDAQADSPLKSFVAVLDSIEKHVKPESLWLLDLEVDRSEHIQAIPTETADAFNSVLERLCHSFPNLQRIRCQMATTPHVPMSVLKMFSTYLPDLTGLELVGGAPHPTLYGFTSSELLEIAKMFPNLDTLGLPLDFEVAPGAHDPKMRPGQGYSHSHLEYLNVGCSPLRNVYSAVLFLSDVFPALNEVAVDYWNFDNVMDNKGMWKLVGAMVPNFALARTQIDNFWRASVKDPENRGVSALGA